MYSDETGFSIYVGNAEHASDLLTLEVKGVTFVLNMAAGEPLCNMTEEVYGPAYRCGILCSSCRSISTVVPFTCTCTLHF